MKNTYTFLISAILVMASLGSYGQQKKTVVFYVAVNGNSGNDGSVNSPFGSLDDARDALQKISGPLDATVYLRGGRYPLSKSFIITQSSYDSTRHITYAGYKTEKVTVTGSGKIDNTKIHPVTDGSILARLPANARGKVYQTDLRESGISGYGTRIQHGSRGIMPAFLELFYNESPLTIARYPNTGFLPVGQILDHGTNYSKGETGTRGGKFIWSDAEMNKWQKADNAWIGGSFAYGYSDENLKVDTFGLSDGTIRLKQSTYYSIYSSADSSNGALKAARSTRGFYVYNLLEELDTAGEWFLDEKTSILYFWPPDNNALSADIEVSQLKDPLVVLSGANNVTFKGIAFADARGMGLLAENTQNTVIQGCSFYNLGTVAISTGNQLVPKKVTYGMSSASGTTTPYNTHLLVQSCKIYNTGTGGILLDGGDRKTLTPASNTVDNCEISNFSRLNTTYCPAVSIDGVGNSIVHCYMHDAPDQAIIFYGNNHLISYNHVRNVVSDMADMGAFYTGRDLSATGTVISYNFFESLKNINQSPVCAVYLDDATSGIQVNSNVFFDACTPGLYHFGAIHINGGGSNDFVNNYFIDCVQAFSNSQWNDGQWKAFLTGALNKKNIYSTVDIRSAPYTRAYPELNKLVDSTSITPRTNYTANTLAYNVNTFSSGSSLVHKNVFNTKADPGFANVAGKNFTLTKKPDPLAAAADWAPIPFNEIGLKK